MSTQPKRHLTSTNGIVTLSLAEDAKVDATAKRLIERRNQIRREARVLMREADAIETALRSAGIKPDVEAHFDWKETRYRSKQLFAESTLPEACKTILQDYKGRWLTKTQIEYLVGQGGYKFSAKDSKNSVNVTLQRLAMEGLIIAERSRGNRGNKYKWPEERKTG